jgi:hypothetical protein
MARRNPPNRDDRRDPPRRDRGNNRGPGDGSNQNRDGQYNHTYQPQATQAGQIPPEVLAWMQGGDNPGQVMGALGAMGMERGSPEAWGVLSGLQGHSGVGNYAGVDQNFADYLQANPQYWDASAQALGNRPRQMSANGKYAMGWDNTSLQSDPGWQAFQSNVAQPGLGFSQAPAPVTTPGGAGYSTPVKTPPSPGAPPGQRNGRRPGETPPITTPSFPGNGPGQWSPRGPSGTATITPGAQPYRQGMNQAGGVRGLNTPDYWKNGPGNSPYGTGPGSPYGPGMLRRQGLPQTNIGFKGGSPRYP